MIFKIILVIVCLLLIIIYIQRTYRNFIHLINKIFNIRIKVTGLNNLDFMKNNKVILMSNHQEWVDGPVIDSILDFSKINKEIFGVTKYNMFGDPSDNNIISNILALFKERLYKYFHFIPYERGNNISGMNTQNRMLELLNNNKGIILFPEGTISYMGVSKEFKPGSFKMCADNNISIIPMTIYYNKQINKNGKFILSKLFNLKVTVHIHKPISNSNWEELRTETYNKIVGTLKDKYKELNINFEQPN
jgi:1-acyl-sn-glycerol-3-phosphate acyltransferase